MARTQNNKEDSWLFRTSQATAIMGWLAGLDAIHLAGIEPAWKMAAYAGYFFVTALICITLNQD